jgi:hypothetical protein
MSTEIHSSGVRLTGFAAASLWHRRLVRAQALNYVRVQPRRSAELVLHPLRRATDDFSAVSTQPRRGDARRHAA